MTWRIRFEKRAQKELERVGPVDQARIARFLRDRIASRSDPREIGEALAGPLNGYWKYRVGDYRIITKIDDTIVTIIVIRIGDRGEVYR